jgi:hypothetical protein
MRRFIPLLALCLLAVPSLPFGTAHAHGPSRSWHRPVHTPAVRVMVEAPEGGSFTTVQHKGSTFVAGELGERYNVRLVNESADRLEVVVTVDGRDVISGKPGDFKRQRGYVLDPFGEVVIDGYRTSLDHVAAFRFSSVRDSYAGRRGTPQNAGVIGVAVFRERVQSRPVPLATRRWSDLDDAEHSRARPKSASRDRAGATKGDKLGTEFGESLVSQVIEVPFVRKSSTKPDELHKVVYDSAERLAARGVPIEPVFVHEPWSPDPSPWPAARHDDRFAPPPPPRRWR